MECSPLRKTNGAGTSSNPVYLNGSISYRSRLQFIKLQEETVETYRIFLVEFIIHFGVYTRPGFWWSTSEDRGR